MNGIYRWLGGPLAVACLCICLAQSAIGQESGEAKPPETLQAVLERIHQHAGGEAWRESGWTDAVIEGWLDRVVGSIAKAAELSQLKLPVRMAEVKPADGKGRAFGKALLVGKGMDLRTARLRNSIVLADGNVEVEQVEGCVIVARGAVVATQAVNSVIVAGAYVKVAADGQYGKSATGSVIISRGLANVARIHGTILAAGEGAIVESIPEGGIFVNAAVIMGTTISATRRRPRSIRIRDFPLEEAPVHPLSKQVEVVGVVYPEVMTTELSYRRAAAVLIGRDSAPPGPTGLVFRLNGRRYAAEVGKPIVNQAEEVVAELADFKLSYLDDEVAIFSGADADAMVSVQGR